MLVQAGSLKEKYRMSILIISTNPLFKEVLIATVGQIQTELIELGSCGSSSQDL